MTATVSAVDKVTHTLSASKDQIATLVANGVKINFATQPMWRWYAWDANGGGAGIQAESVLALVPSLYNTPTGSESADMFTYSWGHASLGGYGVTATHDHVRQCTRLRLANAIPGGLVGVYATHRTQWIFTFLPFDDPANMYLSTGVRGGEVTRSPGLISTEQMIGMPCYLTFNENVGVVEHGSLPYVYLWDDHLKQGIMIRVRDARARGVMFRWYGTPSTGAVTIIVEMYPPARRDLTGAGSSLSFGPDIDVELRPMRGTDWHAAMWHAKMRTDENHVCISRGKHDGPQRDGSPLARRSQIMYHGKLSTRNSTTMGRMREDASRLQAYFGCDIIDYVAHPDAAPEGPWPTGLPAGSTIATGIAAIAADGSGRLAGYTFPNVVDPLGAFYAASSPALSGLVMKNHLGTISVLALPTSGNHYRVNLGHSTARSQMVAFWEIMKTSFPALIGMYTDNIASGFMLDDFGSNVPAANRGVGDPYSHDGVVEYLKTLRPFVRAVSQDGFMIMEFMNEFTMPYGDICGLWSFAPEEGGRKWMPYSIWCWSQYLHFTDFRSYGVDPAPALLGPAIAYSASLQFCRGQRLMLNNIFSTGTEGFLIAHTGDSDYASRWPVWEADYYAWLKLIFVDAFDFLRPYFEGVAGPPLPGSQEEEIRRAGFSTDTLGLPASMLGVHSFVRYAVVNGEPSLVIVLVNWTDEDQTFHVAAKVDDLPWIAGQHTIFEVDPVTHAEEEWTTTDGGFEMDIDLTARPDTGALRIFRLADALPCGWLTP